MMIGFLAEPALLVVIFVVSLTCATTALADHRRTPVRANFRAQPESCLYRGGVHDGVAGRECAYPG